MERKIKHIRNLILIALADNDFCEREMQLIVKIAIRLGLTCKEFEQAMNAGVIDYDIPLTLGEKIEQLNDLVSVMTTDGVIHQAEEKLLVEFVNHFDLTNKCPNNKNLSIEVGDIRQVQSYHEFIKTFRLLTAEKISEVCVDNDFKVRLPLYKTEIKLNALAKTLYLFFLIHPEGSSVKELYKHKELLRQIYCNIPGSHIDYLKRINNLILSTGEIFNQNRSRIHKAIKQCMPQNDKNLEENYFIWRNDDARMHLRLNKDLIVVHPSIN